MNAFIFYFIRYLFNILDKKIKIGGAIEPFAYARTGTYNMFSIIFDLIQF